jgi:AsmA family protein
MRRTLLVIASLFGVLVIAIAALVIFISVFDWNKARPALAARLSQATGRDVSIDGDLRVQWHRDTTGRVHHWLPRLNVSVGQITIGNLPWAKQKVFATSQSVEFDLLLSPLLGHEIFLGGVHLVDPVAHLERRADGTINWALTNPERAPSAWHVRLGRVIFDSGKFDIDDQVRKLRADIVIKPINGPIDFDTSVRDQEKRALALSSSEVGKTGAERLRSRTPSGNHRRTSQRYAFSWTASGRVSGMALSGSGHVGGVLGFHDDEEPWPIQGELSAGDTRLAVVGTLKNPTDLSGMDMRLWMFGSSLADLYPLLGVALPETAKFATDGHVSGELHEKGNIFKYERFNARVGQTDLTGSITYDGQPARPKLTGAVSSELLQFVDLGVIVGARNSEKSAPTAQPSDKALPATQFRVDRWNAMDADVEFSGKQIAELPIQEIKTRIVMENGVLTLKPLHFSIAGGGADSDLRLDGRTSPIKGSLNIAARHLKLNQLFPAFEAMKASIGEVNGDLALTANGTSIAGMLGNSNGEIKMLVDDGTVSKAALETAGLNIANVVVTKLFGDEQVKINCAASDFVVTSGVLDSKLFVFDTDEALIRVDGKVDLGKEALDLTVHPDAKRLRLLSLRSPLRITGTFEHPDIAIDKKALFTRGGGAVVLGALTPFAALIPLIATSGKSENTCAAVFEQMRGRVSAKSPSK